MLSRLLRIVTLGAALVTPSAHAAVYWGDLHAHSELSNDGTGSATNFFTVARDVIGLDFVVLSDHDVFLTPLEWDLLKITAASFNVDHSFVAFSAVEWTRAWHMNVYFQNDDEAFCGQCADAPSFNAFYGPRIDAGLAAAHVNHPIDPLWPVAWYDVDDTVTTAVEVWNSASGGTQEEGFGGAQWALQTGLRLGLVGVSDDHHVDVPPLEIGTGLTGCHAAALTRADLLQALRDRRCYATNGARIEVDLDVDGTLMGGETTAPIGAMVTATLQVVGTDTPTRLELVRNGVVVATKTDCVAAACALSAPVTVADEHTFVYGRVEQAGGVRAWSSPVWVRGQCLDPNDCPATRLAAGGGRRSTDCVTEWRVIPGPDLSPRGTPRTRLTCTDNDATCDADPTVGSCTIKLGVCFGVTDPLLPTCAPLVPTTFELLRPRPQDPTPEAYATLRTGVHGLLLAPGAGRCTPYLDVPVPVDRVPLTKPPRPGKLRLRARAVAGAVVDSDRLDLVCKPAP